MRSIVVRDWAEPVRFFVEESDDPAPGPGEVRIKVHTAAVNFGDALIALGQYQVRPEPPFTPGGEGSGVVEAVGAGVTEFAPGDRVIAMGFIGVSREVRRIVGAFREKLVAPVSNVALVPRGMSLRDAALFRTNYETSYYALQKGELKPGETLLVLGAGGATGRSAVELGKVFGARVIAMASSAGKREIALAGGADLAIDSHDPDWRKAVAAATGGRGVDVVYDPVGGDMTEAAFRSLAWNGRLLVIGFAAGRIPGLPANLPLMKGASMIGVNFLRMMEMEPERYRRNFRELVDLVEQGRLKMPPVTRAYPLEQAREAVEAVLSGKVDGRIVLGMDGTDAD